LEGLVKLDTITTGHGTFHYRNGEIGHSVLFTKDRSNDLWLTIPCGVEVAADNRVASELSWRGGTISWADRLMSRSIIGKGHLVEYRESIYGMIEVKATALIPCERAGR
jgi:hypothetical protein